jgi:hypothetical protein
VPRRLFALCLALAPSCRCDDPECGDDRRDPGELCYADEPDEHDAEIDAPLALRIGRFDGDDHPDLLVVGTDAGGVSGRLLRGDGDGGLSSPRTVAVAGCSAYPIAGDLDADGRDDLVFSTCGQGLLLYLATDGGGFAPPVELPVGVVVRQAAAADVDGDGRRDLLALGLGAGDVPTLSFAQAVPTGGFAPAFLTPLALGFVPTAMITGRLARDGGFQVVLAAADQPGAVARARYAGGAAFAPAAALATDRAPAGLALRDLDGDDVLDLLVGDAARGELATFLADGDELVDGPATALGGAWQSLALGHLDDDGWADLAVVRGARVELWRGGGDGRFESGAEVEFPADVVELALLDLNADGRDDLVAGTFAGDVALTIFRSGP